MNEITTEGTKKTEKSPSAQGGREHRKKRMGQKEITEKLERTRNRNYSFHHIMLGILKPLLFKK